MAQSSQTAGWLERHDDHAGAHVEDHLETREPRTSEPRSSRGPSPHHSGVNDTYDSRRSRACEACRRSKVRCEKSNPNIPCKRCDRAHIECISSSRSNKRPESLNFNDQLMELGGTIDHLISTMQSKTEKTRGARESDTENNDANTIVVEQRSPSHDNTSLPVHLSQQPSAVDDGQLPQQPPPPLEADSISSSQDCSSIVKIASVSAFIEIGIAWIISTHTANAIFGRYCVELAETFPAVVIDPATSAPQVRSSKPVLFLAILAAGSDGICDVDTQKRLRHLLTRVLARCILDKFGYTIEFVQSFIVSALWHKPSEPIQGEDSMDMPQLSHAAANIAIHIGLDRQSSIKNQNSLARRHRQNSRSLKPSQMMDIEARRTWLGCYYICANASMPSQQPSLICWNQYMDECVEALETSPSALPSDRRFCKYVRLQRATDEHSRNIFVSHFFQPGSMSRPITVKILESFKRQLAALDDSTPNSTGNGATQLLYSSSTLYLLEVVATIDHEVDGMDSGLGETQATTFRQLYVGNSTDSSSISECLKSAHSVISIFTSLDFCDIRALPTIFLVRVIHAITILVKSSVSKDLDCGSGSKAPKGDYARIDQLDDLIEVMESWGSDWPGCKLIKILIKLRKWMQNEDNPAVTSGLSRQTGYNSAEVQDTESSTPAFTNLSTSLSYQNHAQQTSPFGLVDFAAHENTADNGPGFWGNFSDLLSQYDKPVHLDSSNTDLWGVQQSQQLAAIWEDMTSDSGFPDDNGYARQDAH